MLQELQGALLDHDCAKISALASVLTIALVMILAVFLVRDSRSPGLTNNCFSQHTMFCSLQALINLDLHAK